MITVLLASITGIAVIGLQPMPDTDPDSPVQFDQHCQRPAASADGRRIVFECSTAPAEEAAGLLINGIFLTDVPSGRTVLMSITPDRRAPSNNSYEPAISGDGEWVAFASEADDIEPGDSNNAADIFLVNVNTYETTRITRAFDFTEANGDSRSPRLSHDGRFVVFESTASNLVENDTNEAADVFVFDTQQGSIKRLSVSADGEEGLYASSRPVISGDGSAIVFFSLAPNLVEGDTNGLADLFVYERATNSVSRITQTNEGVESNGHSAEPELSANGQLVAFHSWATNLVPDDTNGHPDVFVLDRSTGGFTLVSKRADGTQTREQSRSASISASGRYISFETYDDGIMPTDTNKAADIYIVDGTTGTITRASVNQAGEQGDRDTDHATVVESTEDQSPIVIFRTRSDVYTDNDTNKKADIFIRNLNDGSSKRVSIRPPALN